MKELMQVACLRFKSPVYLISESIDGRSKLRCIEPVEDASKIEGPDCGRGTVLEDPCIVDIVFKPPFDSKGTPVALIALKNNFPKKIYYAFFRPELSPISLSPLSLPIKSLFWLRACVTEAQLEFDYLVEEPDKAWGRLAFWFESGSDFAPTEGRAKLRALIQEVPTWRYKKEWKQRATDWAKLSGIPLNSARDLDNAVAGLRRICERLGADIKKKTRTNP